MGFFYCEFKFIKQNGGHTGNTDTNFKLSGKKKKKKRNMSGTKSYQYPFRVNYDSEKRFFLLFGNFLPKHFQNLINIYENKYFRAAISFQKYFLCINQFS